jgi:hypothetical protein
MDKTQLVLLFNKLIEKKFNEFYNNTIKPDIENMIKSSYKKEDVNDKVLRDTKKTDVNSLLSIMEDDELKEIDSISKIQESNTPQIPRFVLNKKQKKPLEFNTKNDKLNNILTEMASDPTNYRLPSENEAASMVMLDGSLKSSVGGGFDTLNFNSDMVNAGANSFSLDDVKTAVAYQSGNSEVADLLIRDYSNILKKSKEISKGAK